MLDQKNLNKMLEVVTGLPEETQSTVVNLIGTIRALKKKTPRENDIK